MPELIRNTFLFTKVASLQQKKLLKQETSEQAFSLWVLRNPLEQLFCRTGLAEYFCKQCNIDSLEM